MRAHEYLNFDQAITQAEFWLKWKSKLVSPVNWQGRRIDDKPEMATHEVTHVSFQVPLNGGYLDLYRQDIKPNLPWADDHFEERVCGYPLNPGVEWENWPYNKSAATFLEGGQFNHNYMERYWPKYAGFIAGPTQFAHDWQSDAVERLTSLATPNTGIRFPYGDLDDVISLLKNDPLTRQAYLPVWFPEDTGGGKRAPCSIGYHFMMRDNRLDVNYEIRSCDFVRHFRDDIYLTVRLLLHVIKECRKTSAMWNDVIPGKFHMQIGSLHCFRNDYPQLRG